MEHTKEPWHYAPHHGEVDIMAHNPSHAVCRMFVDRGIGADTAQPTPKQDAVRIVACVNACAGIPNPAAIPAALAALVESAKQHRARGDNGHAGIIELALAALKGE